MTNKFTPGPWHIPTSPGASGAIAHASGYVAFTGFPRKADETRMEGESWLDMYGRTQSERDLIAAEQDANRRLIAAAPELLAVIDKFLEVANLCPPVDLVRELGALVKLAAAVSCKATAP